MHLIILEAFYLQHLMHGFSFLFRYPEEINEKNYQNRYIISRSIECEKHVDAF